MLVTALCQGRDANIKVNTKQWRATSIRRGGFITVTWERLRSVIALVLAEPILASEEVQGGVQVRVYLVNAVPDGLQRGPPVGSLGLLLAPESGRHEEEEDEGERVPREQGHPRSTGPCPPRNPQGALGSGASPGLGVPSRLHAHASFRALLFTLLIVSLAVQKLSSLLLLNLLFLVLLLCYWYHMQKTISKTHTKELFPYVFFWVFCGVKPYVSVFDIF